MTAIKCQNIGTTLTGPGPHYVIHMDEFVEDYTLALKVKSLRSGSRLHNKT